jgi:anti-sigma factor RsiW
VNDHILPFEGKRHDEAQRLLPWLVNGRLEAEERAWLEQHVASCSECRNEAGELRALQATLQQQPELDPLDTAAGWRRLRRQLQSPRAPRASWWQPLQEQWRQAPRWLAWGFAVQAALVAGFGVALWRQPMTTPAPYRTLSAAPVASAGDLVIVFDPQLDEARMRRLLRASDARIVDGPNDTGAYVLAVPPQRLTAVRNALRAAPGVTLVESLGQDRE